MGVDIPDSYDVDITSIPAITVSSVGPVGPITVAGIPDTFNILVKELPKIQLGIDPVTINPIDLSLRLKELPSQRVHLPADFCVGLSILGMELLALRLCGEAQMINEPYKPNPCEVCGDSGNRNGLASAYADRIPRIA
jgi:hypothetical protein